MAKKREKKRKKKSKKQKKKKRRKKDSSSSSSDSESEEDEEEVKKRKIQEVSSPIRLTSALHRIFAGSQQLFAFAIHLSIALQAFIFFRNNIRLFSCSFVDARESCLCS